MAMIKCIECGQPMSDHAKTCPNCGYERNVIFCPDCGKELSPRATMCPNCGCAINKSSSNNKGEYYGMSIAAFICSFFPISSIVGFILGIIVINGNKGISNTAKNFGTAAVIISGVMFLLTIILFSS